MEVISKMNKRRLFSGVLCLALTTFFALQAENKGTMGNQKRNQAKDQASTKTKKDQANTKAKTEVLNKASQNNQASTDAVRFDEAEIKRISEAFGHIIGKNLENPGFKFNLDSIVKGIRDGAAGQQAPMSEEEYERSISMIQESVFNELSQSNLKKADEFLSQNIHDRDVVEIEAGKLQYKVIEAGNGQDVQGSDAPLIHYTGKYLDGSVFGSSVGNSEPISLPLDQTIAGFSKGLLGAKEGEKRRLYIHPDLAYGTSGHLPPNSLLIFDVEVVKSNSNRADVAAMQTDAFDDLQEDEDDSILLLPEDGEEPEQAPQ